MTIATSVMNGAMFSGPLTSITAGASPYVWTNTENTRVAVCASGGTVSLIEKSIDGGATYYTVGLLAGEFLLNPSQKLRVTYTLAPTMNYQPL